MAARREAAYRFSKEYEKIGGPAGFEPAPPPDLEGPLSDRLSIDGRRLSLGAAETRHNVEISRETASFPLMAMTRR